MEASMRVGYPPIQAFFDFFTSEEVALAQAQRDRKIKAGEQRRTRSKYSPRILTAPVVSSQLPLALLDAPILAFGVNEELRPACVREIHEDMGDVLKEQSTDTDPQELHADAPLVWSDDAVAQLHEGLLFHSLAVLSGRGNALEKSETLQWFFGPDLLGWKETKLPTGQIIRRQVRAYEFPFTFQRCCALLGLNPEVLIEGLCHSLRKAGLGQFLSE